MKTHREEGDFQRFVGVLERRIVLCPVPVFRAHLGRAREGSPDPGDVPYVALALQLDAAIWSDDRALAEQDVVPVLTTSDLLDRLS